jgi:hypothetical protein
VERVTVVSCCVMAATLCVAESSVADKGRDGVVEDIFALRFRRKMASLEDMVDRWGRCLDGKSDSSKASKQRGPPLEGQAEGSRSDPHKVHLDNAGACAPQRGVGRWKKEESRIGSTGESRRPKAGTRAESFAGLLRASQPFLSPLPAVIVIAHLFHDIELQEQVS